MDDSSTFEQINEASDSRKVSIHISNVKLKSFSNVHKYHPYIVIKRQIGAIIPKTSKNGPQKVKDPHDSVKPLLSCYLQANDSSFRI